MKPENPNTPAPKKTPLTPSLLAAATVFAVSVLGGLGVLLWNAGGGGFGTAAASARTLSPGMPAPDFAVPTTDSRTMHLTDYRGRAVFLAFVPSWSDARTVEEVRSLKASAEQFDLAGAKVMLVGPDTPAEAARLHDTEHLPFPALLDTDGALTKRWGVPSSRRTTFVVTPAGQVKFRVGDAAVDAGQHGPQLLAVSKCCVDEVTAARAHGIGKPVGDFSLPRADTGSMETLLGSTPAKATVKATVVVFWSTKCPCANGYNDRLRDWSQKFAAQGVRFVAVYANKDETAPEIAAHARNHGFDFPVYKDERALCADHFGAGVTPQCFVVDAARNLRYTGRLDDNRDPAAVKTRDLPAALDALLTGSAPPPESRAFGCGIVR